MENIKIKKIGFLGIFKNDFLISFKKSGHLISSIFKNLSNFNLQLYSSIKMQHIVHDNTFCLNYLNSFQCIKSHTFQNIVKIKFQNFFC